MQLNIQNLKKIKNSYKNYLKVIFLLLINSKKINVVLRDGNIYTWNNIQVRNYIIASNLRYNDGAKVKFFPDLDKMEFTYLSKRLTFVGFLEDGWIYHELVNFEYNQLNFNNKIVLDIGANSGATSIFFILNGAKYVYAVEPMPMTYSLLKENVRLNKLTQFISTLNYGIGYPSQVNLDTNISGQGAYIDSAIAKTGKSVEIKSLSYIIEKYKIDECVLKMDCEGCEYAALMSLDKNTLKHFSEIMLEFHYGCQNLKKFLEQNGYDVNCTEPISSYNHLSHTKMKSGLLYARKASESR